MQKTTIRRGALRHGSLNGGGHFQKLAKLGLMAISNLPRLTDARPTFISEAWIKTIEEGESPEDSSFWLYFGVAFTLVVLGGVFAGLTLGLMGQDEIYLQVIEQSGDEKERRNATKVLNLLKRGKHWVLVTLLLSNVITNETLPIVLDRSLGGGWPAVLSSTVLIVIFGEIIPQSVCVRYGLGVGALFSPFVLFLMYLMYPVAYPTALLLDYILGEDHGTVYKKAGLKTLVTLHKSLGPHPGERLNQDEVTIISAVLDLKEKPVGAIMTPIKDVFTMSSDTLLDEETMAQILSAGYSRIPIHAPGEPTNFVGMLLVKVLITYDPEDARPVSSFPLATLPETAEDTSCLDIINFFQEGKSHMVLVSEYPGENHGALGVVTLEDVIEELIGEEIVDESDVFIDVTKAIRRLHPSPFALSSATKRQISATYISRNADPEVIAQTASAVASTANPDTSTDLLITSSGITTGPVDPELHHSLEAAMARGRKGSGARLAGLSDDVIAHLTLGPANVAVRPRETTSKTVKIKHVEGGGRKSEDLLISHNNNSGYGSRYTSSGYASDSGHGTAALGAAKFDGAADNAGPAFVAVARNGDADIKGLKKKARTGSLIERTDVKYGIPKTVIETTSSDDESAGSSSPPASRKSGSRGSGHGRTHSDELSPLLSKK
ncbi:hypothetical protein BZA77DRAFT_28189 [Pyronema omphalodes]|nr:hypothetical protein BZA77DRAFT_28189 [Pyronema omphalodes]